MKNILILDDDERLNQTLAAVLSTKFHTKSAYSIKDATKLISMSPFDAIVSDFMLSDGNGLDVLSFINTIQPRPKLIFITAYAEKDMAIELINQKIDAFMEKPFDFQKMIAILEKELQGEFDSTLPTMTLIPYEKILKIGNQNIDLTDVEFKLVGYLLTQKGRWIAREELIEYIWGQSLTSRNTLDTHLSNLKRKIPNFKASLKVVRGRGYMYTPPLAS